ncbi:hypothetical protein [Luminiphilus syltensis]|uniref:hypothetical protein n=1 Tax=Luminiphilus syltensis TaxID=1341119 RepID=UPI0012B55F4C|nr:hypothetical protein [Luminiphilus syltensis]
MASASALKFSFTSSAFAGVPFVKTLGTVVWATAQTDQTDAMATSANLIRILITDSPDWNGFYNPFWTDLVDNNSRVQRLVNVSSEVIAVAV